ncbi:HEAT repeat domain-containing protein [Methanosarcina horonobensis]|uniref:HEAT repeat domain-containing protein n=1 Tax=Methanosarcina horonobensis TaxID=418008 RepID=UPI000ACC3EC3|nr:HEAT repeat domain-containing protein [Methanosarcina horonobensis]
MIIEIGNVTFVPKLIQNLKHITDEEKEYEFLWESEGILASFESNDVIEQLISYAIDKNQSNILRGYCTGALSKSKGKVDILIFKTLAEDDNLLVRRNAIHGLRKYPALEVKEILFRHINDEDGWIQHEIIEILGEKGLLIELVENNRLPIKFYNITVEAYLKQIMKYSLYKLIPTLNELSSIVKDNNRLQIQIAETYCYLSEEGKAKKDYREFL